MTRDEFDDTLRELIELGYVEETGERRADSEGRLCPTYRTSALGNIADTYLRAGFTFEAAMAKAKAQLN